MKAVVLSNDEVKTIELLLWQNPCRSGCALDYEKIDCCDFDKDGKYKCKLKRNIASIEEKLGMFE